MAKKKTKPKLFGMSPAKTLDLDEPQPGIYTDVPFVDYLGIKAFSQSAAKAILKSPAHYQDYLRRPLDTEPLRLGKLFDALLFEPKSVRQEFSKTPLTYENEKGEEKLWAKRGNSNAARAIKEKLEEGGKLLVKRSDYEAAEAMVPKLRAFRPARVILADGLAQVTMIWIDSATGVLCKARVDWWRSMELVDLKSTLAGGAHQLQWPREIWKNRYDVQAGAYVSGRAHLCDGEIVPFVHMVSEKVPPYVPMVYQIGHDTQDKGEKEWARALNIYKGCVEIDVWGGYSAEREIVECYSYNLVESMTANDLLGEGVDDLGI